MSSVAPIHQSYVARNTHCCLNPARHVPHLQLPNLTRKKLVDFTGLCIRSKPDLLSTRHAVPVVPCVGGDGGSSGVGHGSGGGDWSSAYPQFPFKVLMVELVGVSANVLGDMATRPNFDLNDFVFSTLVVGSILNFTFMYLLAPTMTFGSASLPFIFANSPASHMFEPGAYTLATRFGIHMGISSNLRYQSLNGIEFMLAKGLPPLLFKTSVFGLRLVNNLLDGMTFVMLARLTGSQSAGGEEDKMAYEEISDVEKKLLVNEIHSKLML
ncbi:hypothetical protein Hanom_Chr10g00930251 [Helianthus anomalus]